MPIKIFLFFSDKSAKLLKGGFDNMCEINNLNKTKAGQGCSVNKNKTHGGIKWLSQLTQTQAHKQFIML